MPLNEPREGKGIEEIKKEKRTSLVIGLPLAVAAIPITSVEGEFHLGQGR
jgi:hypothetical protein